MDATTPAKEEIIPEPYKWIYIDLKGNWLGLRVEPENKERSEAFKDAIAKDQRWYHRQDRKWMFRTEHGSLLLELLKVFCPEHVLIIEEESDAVIRTLLMGPGDLWGEKVEIPGLHQGRILGPMKNISAGGK